jgi:acyl-CoA reductase-like NAD-dependent aldehyde dehydrogenase
MGCTSIIGSAEGRAGLCVGNTIVLKAAEDAPLGVLLMAEICQEFLPPGVLNVLTELGEECGAAFAEHPLVPKLSFTGSTEVGKLTCARQRIGSCRWRSRTRSSRVVW